MKYSVTMGNLSLQELAEKEKYLLENGNFEEIYDFIINVPNSNQNGLIDRYILLYKNDNHYYNNLNTILEYKGLKEENYNKLKDFVLNSKDLIYMYPSLRIFRKDYKNKTVNEIFEKIKLKIKEKTTSSEKIHIMTYLKSVLGMNEEFLKFSDGKELDKFKKELFNSIFQIGKEINTKDFLLYKNFIKFGDSDMIILIYKLYANTLKLFNLSFGENYKELQKIFLEIVEKTIYIQLESALENIENKKEYDDIINDIVEYFFKKDSYSFYKNYIHFNIGLDSSSYEETLKNVLSNGKYINIINEIKEKLNQGA